MKGGEDAFETRIKVRIDRVDTRGVRHAGAFTLATHIRICAFIAIVTRGLIGGVGAVLADITGIIRTDVVIFTESIVRRMRTTCLLRTRIFRARDAVVTRGVVGAVHTAGGWITTVGGAGIAIVTGRLRNDILTSQRDVTTVFRAGVVILT